MKNYGFIRVQSFVTTNLLLQVRKIYERSSSCLTLLIRLKKIQHNVHHDSLPFKTLFRQNQHKYLIFHGNILYWSICAKFLKAINKMKHFFNYLFFFLQRNFNSKILQLFRSIAQEFLNLFINNNVECMVWIHIKYTTHKMVSSKNNLIFACCVREAKSTTLYYQ